MTELFDPISEKHRLELTYLNLGRAVGSPIVNKLTEPRSKDERIGSAHMEYRDERGNLIQTRDQAKHGRPHQVVWHLEAPAIGASGIIFFQTEGSIKLRTKGEMALFRLREKEEVDGVDLNCFKIYLDSARQMMIGNNRPIYDEDGKFTYTFEPVPITTLQFDDIESQVKELANYTTSLKPAV